MNILQCIAGYKHQPSLTNMLSRRLTAVLATTGLILSACLSVVAHAQVPNPPTAVSAAPGNAKATISFTPGTAPPTIGGYTVTASPGGATGTGTSSPIDVLCLTNGVAYTFTITANNGSGTSAAAAPANVVIPRTTPDAPTINGATPGNAVVTVAFTAPAFNGGSAVTGYTVTPSPSGTPVSGNSSPLIVA